MINILIRWERESHYKIGYKGIVWKQDATTGTLS